MIKIGLTGGIGAGKSTVAKIISTMGFPIYYSDTEAAKLMTTNKNIINKLISQFGKDTYTENGYINKPYLSNIIFKDNKALSIINNIVHPEVINDFNRWCLHQKQNIVFFESAIIFEGNLQNNFDQIINITATEETRINRVIKRDNCTRSQVKERINKQLPENIKCKQSNHTIYSDRTDILCPQIIKILTTLTN